MGDIRDMTKGELREEVSALRRLVSQIYQDAYEVEDEWHGITHDPFGKGLVTQAESTMGIIQEYRETHV